jgi:NAD(P)-dependent dehydrogenase (short-subunit alcohol dehydrogenase family)
MAVTIVTGAASGIGRGLATAFAQRGHHVVVADLDLDAAIEAADAMPGSASAARVDVTDADDVEALVASTEDAHGPLDVIVNNAGISAVGWSHELPLDRWQAVFDVNLRGVVHGVAAAYPRFAARRSGRIVNMASLSAFSGVPTAAAYAASKHAVLGLTRSLRIEARLHGVHVHAVCPGFVDTPLLHDEVQREGLSFAAIARAMRMPVTTVDRVVADTMKGIARDRGVIITPATASVTRWVSTLAPDPLSDAILTRTVRQLPGA